MASFIPEDKVSEIKNSVDIFEIISETVVLKKAGKNYQGLCPFHAEKTPSFTVSPAKQIFYCFGCGAGGNVFSFLMKKEGLSFPEAVGLVAKRGGVALPSPKLSQAQKQRQNEREGLFGVNKLAMGHFAHNLTVSIGRPGRDYLEKRGISQQTIDTFHLGFAPEGWDGLVRFLRSKNVPEHLGEKAGLLRPRKQSPGYYDGFRNRIVFPIFDMGARVIGFGGRVMDDSLPKYLNSPETPVYNKRRSLYGLQAARNESRAQSCVFVVEGYFDLLALHQNGISNSVATLGTALTPEHLQILKGFIGNTGQVVLVFDSDNAGIKAAERSIDVFTKGFVDAKILVLPEGHDPDSFLMASGARVFLEKSSHALSIIPFLIASAIRRNGLTTDGKVRVVSEMEKPLAAVEDGMTRALYIRDLSEKIGVDEVAVLERVNSVIAKNKYQKNSGGQLFGKPRDINSQYGTTREKMPPVSIKNRLEKQIIAMMFQFPEILPSVQKKNLLALFENDQLRQIGDNILKRTTIDDDIGPRSPADVISQIKDNELRNIAALLAIGDDPWNFAGCQKLMAQFEESQKRNDKTLIQKIRSAESAGDHDLVIQLQTQLLKEKQAMCSRKI